MTYTEKVNFEPFNWSKALNSELTDIDWKNLHKKSSRWITCACGNLCEKIPRYYSGKPMDGELARLGYNFNQYIIYKHKSLALKTLEEIEKRSIIILKTLE